MWKAWVWMEVVFRRDVMRFPPQEGQWEYWSFSLCFPSQSYFWLHLRLSWFWPCSHRVVTSCMTKQPARSSLTFTTKFLCLRNPTRAWLKHSNGFQGQRSAHAYLGVTSQCPRGWYRWTCVTWRQLTDAPLDSKHSSIPSQTSWWGVQGQTVLVSRVSVQGPRLHTGVRTRRT